MRYKITFLDYWHLSSGLSAGAKLDSMVVKDAEGFPYVPGKTIKGLIREMMELIDADYANRSFGQEEDKHGACYFSNAALNGATKLEIQKGQLLPNLFDEISSTKINENGIAENGSLRKIEVAVPMTMYGEINGCSDEAKMQKAMKMVKRMGLNRSRGLGRCQLEVIGAE